MWTRSSSTIRWKQKDKIELEREGVCKDNERMTKGCSSRTLKLLLANSPPFTVLFLYALGLSLTFCVNPVGANIDCFKCVSLNGNNPSCEDPFHNNYSSAILESPCMGGRKGRNGLFPATACIKLAGHYADTGESITIRGCALDSGTLTTDTELIRMSHCGRFYFEERYVKGCVQSCDDADGCNGSVRLQLFLLPLILSITFQIIMELIFFLPSHSRTS